MSDKKPTKEDLLKICGDVTPFRDIGGKVQMCKHLRSDGHLCELNNHFTCEVKDHFRRVNAKHHTSYSRVSSYIGCPLKARYRYHDKVQLPEQPSWFYLGREFHKCRAKIAAGMEWEISPPPPEVVVAPHEIILLEESLNWFADNYKLFPTNGRSEVDFEFTTPGGRLVIGQVDFLYDNDRKIDEWKYAKADHDQLVGRRQLSTYFKAFPLAHECTTRTMRKFSIKPKKIGARLETPSEFRERARAFIKEKGEKGELVISSTFHRDEFPIEEEINAIDVVHECIGIYEKHSVFPGVYFGMVCQMCEYHDHCKHMKVG